MTQNHRTKLKHPPQYLTVVLRLAANADPRLVFAQTDRIQGATLAAAAWSRVMDERDALSALRIAREAMAERRGYAAACEYKYSADWDEEDRYVDCQIALADEQQGRVTPLPKERQATQ